MDALETEDVILETHLLYPCYSWLVIMHGQYVIKPKHLRAEWLLDHINLIH